MNYIKNIKLGFCDETYRFLEASCEKYRDEIKVIDRHHARAIRRKINHKVKVITGDVFYKNLSWYDTKYKINDTSSDGVAIERDGKIIWYSMPGRPEGTAKRKVLFEKYDEFNIKEVLRKIRD